MNILDCRNMACPAPVVTVRRTLAELPGTTIRVLVDPGAARENVTRFALSRGCTVTETAVDNGWELAITPGKVLPPTTASSAGDEPAVILVASERLGEGPEELGALLMKNFLITLLDLENPPHTIFFVNRGVMLVSEESESLEALTRLADRGITIQACGVCLDFFHLRDKLAVGSVTNMFTIAETMLNSGNTVRI